MTEPKAPADPFDTRVVRELAEILNDTGLTEIELDREGLRIRVARTLTAATTVVAAAPAAVAAPTAAQTPAAAAAPPAITGEVVKSPMVGTVYLQPQPGSPAFAKVGDTVLAGQTLMLVEAMKTMNPIIAPKGGKLTQFLVTDAQPVEYGEPLAVIE